MTQLKLIIALIVSLNLFISISTLAAPQLQATVDPNEVRLGESLNLSLTLLNASADELNSTPAPDLSPLAEMFEIDHGNKSIQQFNIQGQESSQVTWQYMLEPKKTGTFTIPALSVTTASGPVYSQPLQITVTAGNTKRRDNVHLEATVSNAKPYLYQPILYTLRIYQRGDLQNLQALPPSEGVIMESLGEMTARRQIVNGQPMVVNEAKFILTPIRSGQLDLSTAKMKGLQPDRRNNSFGGSFFSFSTDYRPITLTSDPLTIAVQSPPATAPAPWLPLNNLTLEQTWETDISQPVIVGVPLIRTLTLTAAGMGAQPAPALDKLASSPDFRMRNPKPETQRQLSADGKTPVSIIKQTVSLIPVNTGKLQLPAIRMPWWNVQTNTVQWAELPAQSIEVMPSPNPVTTAPPIVTTPSVSTPAPVTTTTRPIPQYLEFDQVQYTLFTLSIFALLVALWHSWYTRRSAVIAATMTTPYASSRMSDSTLKQRLQAAQELAAVKQLLQEYAHSRWHTPPQASLQQLAHHLSTHYENGRSLAGLLKELNAAVYGSQTLSLVEWKSEWLKQLSQLKEIKRPKPGKIKRVELGPLNPV